MDMDEDLVIATTDGDSASVAATPLQLPSAMELRASVHHEENRRTSPGTAGGYA